MIAEMRAGIFYKSQKRGLGLSFFVGTIFFLFYINFKAELF